MKSRFRLEGDFDIRAEFSIESLPMPRDGWINVELFIDGPGGPASVMRTNHSTEGAGFSCWWEPPAKGVPGVWTHVGSESKRATLQLKRERDLLTFHILNPGKMLDSSQETPDQIQLSSVKYGTLPIDRVELRVAVPETETRGNVAFHNVSIDADEIPESMAAGSPIGPGASYRMLLLGVSVGVLLFAAWLRRASS
ncbi:hypothetical protein [Maioricimonas rarisocia]|nr:hypothetical protein [Maioricimonas rarisocia]